MTRHWIQGARGNKDGFAQLARESCELVYVVIGIYEAQAQDGKDVPQDLNEDIGGLVRCVVYPCLPRVFNLSSKILKVHSRKLRNFPKKWPAAVVLPVLCRGFGTAKMKQDRFKHTI
jgi:hypothetical protein